MRDTVSLSLHCFSLPPERMVRQSPNWMEGRPVVKTSGFESRQDTIIAVHAPPPVSFLQEGFSQCPPLFGTYQ